MRNSMATPGSTSEELNKYAVALLVALGGMLIAAVVVCVLAFQGRSAAEISTVAGMFTTLIGTLVGTFLGVQVAGAGKQKAEDMARKALGALSPTEAAKITNPPDAS
jgi:hypothetical protein